MPVAASPRVLAVSSRSLSRKSVSEFSFQDPAVDGGLARAGDQAEGGHAQVGALVVEVVFAAFQQQ